MEFNSLEKKCVYYKSLTDYKLMPNSYVICMLDGRNFSSIIKKHFEQPFDAKFIDMMNETAAYLCQNISGCKLAYVQSDEISLILTDFEKENTGSIFGYRLCKLLPLIASMASGKFNQLWLCKKIEDLWTDDNIQVEKVLDKVKSQKRVEFDCKCWNVPSFNDAMAWLLFRQNECIRNSKNQTAQTYLPYKELLCLTSDKMVEKLKDEKGIDWNDLDDGMKYGRFIYKEKEMYYNIEMNTNYERSVWNVHNALPLNIEENRNKFISLNIIPVLT